MRRLLNFLFPGALLGMALVAVSGCDFVKSQRENERIAKRMLRWCATSLSAYDPRGII